MKKVLYYCVMPVMLGVALLFWALMRSGISWVTIPFLVGACLLTGGTVAVTGSIIAARRMTFSKLHSDGDSLALFLSLLSAGALCLGIGLLLLYGEIFR